MIATIHLFDPMITDIITSLAMGLLSFAIGFAIGKIVMACIHHKP